MASRLRESAEEIALVTEPQLMADICETFSKAHLYAKRALHEFSLSSNGR